MDKKTVFVKTKEGEEAMRQRTRLVQRNLRSILIMVDGRATVAELSERFGDRNAAEAALAELEAGGFITALRNQLDFTRPEAEAPGECAGDVPVLTSKIVPTPAPDAAPGTTPSASPPLIEKIELTAPEYESLPPPLAPSAPPSKPASPPAARPPWLERIQGWFARTDKPGAPATRSPASGGGFEEEPPDTPEPAAILRTTRSGWPMLVLLCVAGIAVLSILTLLLYPYGRHLPDIERNASAMLGEPVRIGSVDVAFLPQPHIVLHNVTAGQAPPHLSIGSVQATPEFSSLLDEKKVFRHVTLRNIAVRAAGLGRLARAAASAPAVDIRQLSLVGLSLSVGETVLPGHDGEVILGAGGAVEAIELRNAEGTLKLRLEPKGEAYRIAATGNAWKAPFKPVLTFQWLEARGELRPDRLELENIEAKAFDGLLAGKVDFGWAGDATLAGEIELKRMNAEQLLAALGADLSARGDLSVRLKLTADSDGVGTLSDALRVAGAFEMGRGAVLGLDLVEAARSRGPTRGGETKFEQLSGQVECDPQGCRLGGLQLASGLLTAGGSLGVARAGPLSGTLSAVLKSSAATVRIPLSVGGSAKDPVLTTGRAR